jgi:hypothetical protein
MPGCETVYTGVAGGGRKVAVAVAVAGGVLVEVAVGRDVSVATSASSVVEGIADGTPALKLQPAKAHRRKARIILGAKARMNMLNDSEVVEVQESLLHSV